MIYFFNNVKKIIYNEKEIKNITDNNGIIIWEKEENIEE